VSSRIYEVPRSQRARPGRPVRGGRRGGRAWWLPLIVLLVLLALVTPGIVNALVTYWWFGELGYSNVYTTEIAAGIALGVAGTVVSFLILKGLAFFVTRVARRQGRAQAYRGLVRLSVNGAILILSVLLGLGLSGDWQRVLFALHQTPFNRSEPVFHHDVAFYIFTLPLLRDLLGWLGLVLFLGLIVALVLLYALDLGGRINATLEPYVRTGQVVGAPQFDIRWLRPYLTVVSFWLALLALVVAGSNWLMRYDSLVSPGNGFQGGSYVDLHAGIPGWTILTVLAVLGALVLLVNAFTWRRWAYIAGAVALWLAGWLLLVGLYPGILQGLKVNPAPLAAEGPQIQSNINATRAAFNLGSVHVSQFPSDAITMGDVTAGRSGINSLRVEDPDQFTAAAQQQQAIRLFYDFTAAGLDRYRIGGRLRQLIVSPRELNQGQLPSQTWQNLNFTYTHGYGVVVSPVNAVSGDGSPQYLVKDIPPHVNPDIPAARDLPAVTRPGIYFGQDTTSSVFVKTGAQEFDYGTGDTEYHTPYAGKAGITIGGALKRLAWTIYFGSPIQFGTSSYLTSASRVLLHREITDRLTTLAPFLTYDSNPYLVLGADGRLTWIVDGYTTSANYPYAQPYTTPDGNTSFSYIRNAVKVTIDAYNGTARLYVADRSDPIARTIDASFPGLLQPLSAMPADLRAHVRYPEDLLNAQSAVYARYHQTNPQAWYNNDDQWAIPSYSSDGKNSLPVPPYYAVTRLPGDTTDEFVLMQPYNPLNKNNMVSLLVGRSDAPHYGELIEYHLPFGRQVLGPQQLQANVNQRPDFSQVLSLWNQQGSRVHWGQIIIVPVGRGLLYLEPLYLQAENSKIPQLQRVIAYANNKLVWGTSLDNALGQIFGNAPSPPPITSTTPATGTVPITPISPTIPLTGTGAVTGTALLILQQVQQHLIAAQQAAGRGDFTTYGKEVDTANKLLRQALGQK